MTGRLRLPSSLLGRVRWLFVVLYLLVVPPTLVQALMHVHSRPVAVLGVVLAAGWLMAWAVICGRLVAAPLPLAVPTWISLCFLVYSTGDPEVAAGVFWIGLMVVTLYGTVAALWVMVPGMTCAYVLAFTFTPDQPLGAVIAGNLVGVVPMVAIIRLLGHALERHEGLLDREAVMSATGMRLLTATSADEVMAAVRCALRDVLGVRRRWHAATVYVGPRSVRYVGVSADDDGAAHTEVVASEMLPPGVLERLRATRVGLYRPHDPELLGRLMGSPGFVPTFCGYAPLDLGTAGHSCGLVLAFDGGFDGSLVEPLESLRAMVSFALQRNAAWRRHLALAEHSSDMVLVLDSEAVVTYASASAARIIGRAPDELVGTGCLDLVDHADRPVIRGVLAGGAHDGGTVAVEVRMVHADGELRHLELMCTDQRHDAAVEGVIVNARDVTARRQLDEQLRYQALHDPLTVLPNRALLIDRLDQALRGRRVPQLAVMLLDLDSFKSVNDSYGHAAGDMLLIEVAGRIQSAVRASDTVARLGGDEFALIIEDGRTWAPDIAERLLQALQEPYMLLGAKGMTVSASIGIAFSEPGDDAGQLLRNADLAMYAAKHAGRNRIAVFTAPMHTQVVRRTRLEMDLRRAAQEPEVQYSVVYQPVMATLTGRIVGFEALLRWMHADLGPVPPDEFIPLAESSRDIVGLGRWVLERACRQAVQWRDEHPALGPLRMSVNLSPVQLREGDVVDDVATALRNSGLEPERLVLEITESALSVDIAEMVEILGRLRGLGVKLAVDDFGTGQSSLGHLASYPVHLLKIDRALVDGCADVSGRRVLQSAVELGRSLGLWVVAEGVETEAHRAMLPIAPGVFAQGYLFSPPLNAAEAGELLIREAATDAA